MADTTFTNGVTLTDADWFNDLNRLHYTIFADPANAAAAATAIGVGTASTPTFAGLNLSSPLAAASGGTGISSLGTGVATALGQAVSGSGNIALTTSPVFTTPNIGTPSAATLTNATGLPLTTGVTGTLPVANGGTGATSLTANNVLLGNGTSALQVVAPGTSGNVLTSNGTTWVSSASTSSGFTLGTATSLSGTSTTLTGIPSTVKVVILTITGMSTNGTSNIVCRIGPSGGVVNTGYTGSQYNWTGSASGSTSDFIIRQTGASSVGNGMLMLTLLNSSTNTWAAQWNIGGSDTAQGYTGAATVALSGALERIALTTSGGTDTFDAGSINIAYM